MRVPGSSGSRPASESTATTPLTPVNKNKLVTLKNKIPTLSPPTGRSSTQATPPSSRATAITQALAQGILQQKGMLKVRHAVEETARNSIRGQSTGTSRPLKDRAGAPVGTTLPYQLKQS